VQFYFYITAGYALSSSIAFLMYWIDKRAARADRDRISERSLHLWAVLGGWPGALLAQKMFRHKTYKKSFRVVFGITVLLNVLLLAAVLWVFGT